MNDLHERKHGVLEECSGSEGPLCCLGDVLSTLRPHASQNLDNIVITGHHLRCHDNHRVFGVEEKPLEVLEESVPVLLDEATDVVDHVAGVVLHLIIGVISGDGDNNVEKEEDFYLEVFLV